MARTKSRSKARRKSTSPRKELRSLVSPAELLGISLTSGFQQRVRNLELLPFVYTLAFGFGVAGPRRVQALWQFYGRAATKSISKTSFYEWLTKPTIVPFLQAVIAEVSGRLADTGGRLAGALGQFQELFVTDSSTISLPDALREAFPGTRKNSSPAAVKLHIVQQVKGAGIRSSSIKVTAGTTNDSKAFQVGPWVQDGLLLFDLGYYCFRRFRRIEKHGGYFISRLKDNANPTILRSLTIHRGRKVDIVGEKLQDVLGRLRRQILDLEVEVKYETRAGSKKPMKLRLVGVWNQADRCYHLYLTNVRPDQLSAEQVADAYRLRWQVELLFREMKGVHRLEEIPGENPVMVEAMIYASILSALVTRRLLASIRRTLELEEGRLPHERGARIVQDYAQFLLQIMVKPLHEIRALEKSVSTLMLDAAEALASARRSLLDERLDLRGRSALQTAMG